MSDKYFGDTRAAKATYGIILVITQFLLIISIAILGLIQGQATIARNIGIIFGIAVGIMALYSMKFSMSVLPKPKKGQGLIENGIYKFVRHPAYLGVLIFTASFICSWHTFVLWIFLFGILFLKMKIEEKMLQDKFAEYKDYKKRTKMIIPFII
jgi:protein-S-isoprenylcysteine O-methyltransferase Ste14